LDKEVLEWSIHPFKESKKRSILLIVFLIILSIIVFLIFPNITFTLIAFSLLIISLRGFFFKTTYKLDSESLTIKMFNFEYKKKFSDFKRIYIGDDALLISPFTYKTRLNKYRGVYAIFPEKLHKQIQKKVEGKLEIIINK